MRAQKQATFFGILFRFDRRRNQQQSSMGQIGCQLQINLPFHSEILSILNLPGVPRACVSVCGVYTCVKHDTQSMCLTLGVRAELQFLSSVFMQTHHTTHTHSIGLGMLYKSFSLQHRKSWQHGKYYQSNIAACTVSFLTKHFPMSNVNWNWKETVGWVHISYLILCVNVF